MKIFPEKAIPARVEVAALLVIMALAVAMRLTFLHEPFERDEGFFAYQAQELLRGAIPYKEIIDNKPPGIMYLYALVIGLFSIDNSEGIRIFTAFYAVGTLLAVYWLARRLAGYGAGLLAGLFYALFSSGPLIQGSSSNGETFLVLPLMLSACFFVAWLESSRRTHLLVSGLFAGCAMFIKTVALPVVALMLCFILYAQIRPTHGRRGGALSRAIGAIGDLAAFGLFPILLYGAFALFLVRHDALQDAVYWNFTAVRSYGETPLSLFYVIMKRGFAEVYREHLFLYLLALPASLRMIVRGEDRSRVFAALLLPAALMGVCMPGKFFPHYFIQLIPPLALLAGVGGAVLWERKGRLLYAAAPVLAAALALWAYVDYEYYFVLTPDEVCLKKYETSGPDFVAAPAVAAHIKASSRPGDYTYQWTFEPQVYFLSGLRAPNPYYSFMMIPSTPDPEGALYRINRSLWMAKPHHIVVSERGRGAYGWEIMENILSRRYLLERKIGSYSIYRLKS
ncbi:glycosyltransferase family 39 protein [Geobacter sp. DSM 9736]|uniref:ArnT family glycosyltransferase n=1 Tax=Geobacter sp. DSM 9736 TaxID=1277350 RepID=UPI000B50C23C|nr:glycosyltransferase family 39 protein [Geobacter sp. DSM 9736]SNB44646.1 4-amino-4-deoxy-L-arabinose transferase [Geobacter sp. DSM 9736]